MLSGDRSPTARSPFASLGSRPSSIASFGSPIGQEDRPRSRTASWSRISVQSGGAWHDRPASFFVETLHEEVPEERESELPLSVASKGKRSYWLDWLRIASIYLVVSFHVVQCLQELGLWQSEGERLAITNYMATSLQFGMPVFFHISGRAQALAKGSRMRQMLWLRTIKLLLPAVVAYFLLIPNREYIFDTTALCWVPTCGIKDGHGKVAQRDPWLGKRDDCRCTWSDGFPWNYPRYIVHYFTPGVYHFNSGWLWFLPALFAVCVLSGTTLQYSETRQLKYAAIAFCSWMSLALLFLFVGYSSAFVVFTLIGQVVGVVLSRFVPFPQRCSEAADERSHLEALESSAFSRWFAARCFSVMNVLTCVGIVSNVWYRHPDGSPFQEAAGPAFILNLMFYQQGYHVQRWDAESMAIARDDTSETEISWFVMCKWMYQVLCLGMIFLVLCLSSPVGEMEQMIYPIYSASFDKGWYFGVLHVLGTVCYIEIAVQMFRAFCDRQIHPTLYSHASKSTIVVYIFHWMFAALFSYWVFYPLGMTGGIWNIIDPILLFVLTSTSSIGLYALLTKSPSLGCIFGI